MHDQRSRMYDHGRKSSNCEAKRPMRYKSSISSNCLHGTKEFQFIPPSEAPIFKPSEEDFAKGPLEYINKIRPFAEKHGICKIIPPASFQPPFAVDVEQFRFTPRVQRLNELEAQTRVKLNFLEQVMKYWDLQGAALKIPSIDKKLLDLYTLHKVVGEEGGFETCTREKKWSTVAMRMNFNLSPQNKGTISSLLRQHYERILYPYDVFLSGATVGPDVILDYKRSKFKGQNAKIDVKIEKKENGNETVNSVSEEPIRPNGRCNGQVNDRSNKYENANDQSKEGAAIKKEKKDECIQEITQDNLNTGVDGVCKQNVTEKVVEERKIIKEMDNQLNNQVENESLENPAKKPKLNSENDQNGITNETAQVNEGRVLRTSPRRLNKVGKVESNDATNEREDKERLEPIQLRPSPRRLARRMQSQQRRRPNFPRVDKELQRLQVYGAGPKMPGFSSNDLNSKLAKTETNDLIEHSRGLCLLCSEDLFPHQLLKCAGCDNSFHLYCLIPPLNDMPKGVWHCPRCVAYFVASQPQPFTHEFGFAQSLRDYSLSEFGEMADQFKTDYFKSPPHMVPLSSVEKEFWRLVSSMDDNVIVEYGADLHTNDFGSGFPTAKSKLALPSDVEYVNHPWNLNNLPILDGSVFKYINSNISGMIVPWIYVGMCFSAFCWHNEDHWSYSINYLHWGEPKTWYGVPGDSAESFEKAMENAAPELFESQPDLLHQLVTICNPNILMKAGVPIFRTNQKAGEFVVTFPRAYHAGFNQGLNLAEAVNFAPSNWISLGRDCVSHYSALQRYPVFSHDELVCKMANYASELDISIAAATFEDLMHMVELEKEARLELKKWGVSKKEKKIFECLPDDERQCEWCKTTCYLSCLRCECHESKYVCLPHKDRLCSICEPSKHTLLYRYTLDEFPAMLSPLKARALELDEWVSKANKILAASSDECEIETVKHLVDEAKSKGFPLSMNIYKQLEILMTEMITGKREINENSQVHDISEGVTENELNGEEIKRENENGTKEGRDIRLGHDRDGKEEEIRCKRRKCV